MDFVDKSGVEKAIALSEATLDSRQVLIKDAYSTKATKATDKKQVEAFEGPNPTLFVGNLPFEATKQKLMTIFSIFGSVRKIRLMTFEDSGKCKG